MGLSDFFNTANSDLTYSKLGRFLLGDSYTNNMPPLVPRTTVDNIQVNEDGTYTNNQDTIPEKTTGRLQGFLNNIKPKINTYETKLGNALFGTAPQVPEPENQIMDNGGEIALNSGVAASQRQGGLLRDIGSGFNENFRNSFTVDNMIDNFTDDGRKKGLAYRIGEGLGSLGKAVDSPLGRMAITAGAVGAFGGSPLQMAGYGATAGLLNQQARTADNVYRNQLQGMGIDTSNAPGYINDKTYQNLALNTYRSKNLDIKEEAQSIKNEYTKLKAEEQRIKNQNLPEKEKAELLIKNAQAQTELELRFAKISAYKNGTALGWANYGLKRDENQNDIINKNSENKKALQAVEAQLDSFSKLFHVMPSKTNAVTAGRFRKLTGTNTAGETEFNAQRTLLYNVIARKLGGEKGVLSDQDIKRIEDSLPVLTDSLEQKQAKMKAVNNLLNIRYQEYGINSQEYGNNNIIDRLGIL